jgi:ABC transporter ATM
VCVSILPLLCAACGGVAVRRANGRGRCISERAGGADISDGAARVLTTAFGELRNALFASISQGAIRKVARETFEHLLNMDMKFHLERQTGGLTRAIDRGTK